MSISDQYEKPEPKDWHHSAIGRVRHALKKALDPDSPNSRHGEWSYPRFWDDIAELLDKVEFTNKKLANKILKVRQQLKRDLERAISQTIGL